MRGDRNAAVAALRLPLEHQLARVPPVAAALPRNRQLMHSCMCGANAATWLNAATQFCCIAGLWTMLTNPHAVNPAGLQTGALHLPCKT